MLESKGSTSKKGGANAPSRAVADSGGGRIIGAVFGTRVKKTAVRPHWRSPSQDSGGDGMSSAVAATEERQGYGNAPARRRSMHFRSLFILFVHMTEYFTNIMLVWNQYFRDGRTGKVSSRGDLWHSWARLDNKRARIGKVSPRGDRGTVGRLGNERTRSAREATCGTVGRDW